MQRNSIFKQAIFTTVIVMIGATTASANWHERMSQKWHRFWHDCGVGLHRNNAWPDPFVEADALQVVAPFEAMKRNGWRLHNTIGDNLFRDSDGELLASGHNRLHWIATQAPLSRREVFVLRGRSDTETDARVASVREALSRIDTRGSEPTVYVTDIEPSTASGAWATQINRMYMQQLPAPKLPSSSASGTQGTTQSGGGASTQ